MVLEPFVDLRIIGNASTKEVLALDQAVHIAIRNLRGWSGEIFGCGSEPGQRCGGDKRLLKWKR